MLQASDPINVTLTAGEWNQVLAILGEAPYRVVAALIGKIQGQGLAQAPAAANGPEDMLHVPH
jgi:hypothetical protein